MKDELSIKRLGWAGIQLTCGEQRLVIDLFETADAMAPFIEEVSGPLPSPDGPVDVALVTHLHADHTDARAIGRALRADGVVFRPAAAPGDDLDRAATVNAESGLAAFDQEVATLAPWETRETGPFVITAVPAVDGFGDPQVSWVVEAGRQRIFHGGDTTFHGGFWPIASRFKPFDAAFLPINGAVCDFPHRQPPSPGPASLDPEQAALTADILGASVAIPIHYDGIYQPGIYQQVENPSGAFAEAASARGVSTRILEPGETLRESSPALD